MNIHPTAIIHDGAKLGEDVKIGPYCIVGPKVTIGARVELVSHVVIDGNTEIGDDTVIYPFAAIGLLSQDLKWQDESAMTGTRIGKRNKIREYVTISSGTPASTGTEIGDDCQIMINAHVGHDCKVGNSVVLSNVVQLGGHTEVEDFAIVSGGSMVHQFCRIGRNAFIGGMTGIGIDVPPYSIFEGRPGVYRTINKTGLLRHGFTNEDLHAIHKVYSAVFGGEGEGGIADKLKKIRREVGGNKYAMDAIDFIENRSRRGIDKTRITGA
ncbi:MAG: acyl-ACP--UDP-N-acetylglucosamine O-acyltransferase [Rickettsiales bacterium]|jgi:UDP-N-acetylglucosamine acyltransferase|nr:acyl-ACP--UDP-N-acetylglucosamine O-acyltransferase [Rickettsiales bacterium]